MILILPGITALLSHRSKLVIFSLQSQEETLPQSLLFNYSPVAMLGLWSGPAAARMCKPTVKAKQAHYAVHAHTDTRTHAPFTTCCGIVFCWADYWACPFSCGASWESPTS